MRGALLLLFMCVSTASAELYTWKDSSGTSHYTNLPDAVPLKYRKKMKVVPMPGDQKKEAPHGAPAGTAPGQVSLPMPPPAPTPAPSPTATASPAPAPPEQAPASRRSRRQARHSGE